MATAGWKGWPEQEGLSTDRCVCLGKHSSPLRPDAAPPTQCVRWTKLLGARVESRFAAVKTGGGVKVMGVGWGRAKVVLVSTTRLGA